MDKTYQIGDLARVAAVPVETIRYYERDGLLAAPKRSAGNFRLYSETHRERLIFIRQCRALDMTLEEIRNLLALKDAPQKTCSAVNALLEEHINHVSSRIEELRRLKRDLEALRTRCKSVNGTRDCAILAGLASGTATTEIESQQGIHRTHPARKRATRSTR